MEIPKTINHQPVTDKLSAISEIALGALAFGWYLSEKESFEILNQYVGFGGNIIDTSDNYCSWAEGKTGGESECLIGKWLKKEKPVPRPMIATKFGGQTVCGNGFSKGHIINAIHDSLNRLNVETIDIYQILLSEDEFPDEDSFYTLKKLQLEGKINHIGFCNLNDKQLTESYTMAMGAGIENRTTFQVKLNFLEQERINEQIYSFVNEKNMHLLCYGLLARGFLSGKYVEQFDHSLSFRANSVKKKYYSKNYFSKLDDFRNMASRNNCEPYLEAYKWAKNELVKKGVQGTLIGGFTSKAQLVQLVKGLYYK